jgi:hypothetical protein
MILKINYLKNRYILYQKIIMNLLIQIHELMIAQHIY